MKKHIIAFIQLIPVIISMLLIAAHFLRANNIYLVAVCFILLLGLLVRAPLPAKVMQGTLVISTIEWIRTAYTIVSVRMQIGLPWTRLAVILGAVACFTLTSGLVFFSKTLKERYMLEKKTSQDE
jgi:uncharacterized membrane protein